MLRTLRLAIACSTLWIFLLISNDIIAQPSYYNPIDLLQGKKKVVIPFKYQHNFILLDVHLFGILPVQLIFDTGAEHIILFKREFTDVLGIPYDKRIPIMGSDLSREIYALIIRNGLIQISGLPARPNDMLVLEENYFNLDEMVGAPIAGLIGGVYVYLREAYGGLWGFLYGWCSLTVITSGAIAGLCLVFSHYLCFVLGIDATETVFSLDLRRFRLNTEFALSYQHMIAMIELVIVSLINIFGVKFSSLFSSGLTVIKLVGIGLIVIIAVGYGNNLNANLNLTSPNTSYVSFGIALIGVLWSYGGWHHASYVGGEVVNAQKVLPKALFFGALIVTITYLLVNLGFLALLPYQEITTSNAIAADALRHVTSSGGILIAILIAISTFGTASIYALSTPRIYFMMGVDKVFYPWLSEIHPK